MSLVNLRIRSSKGVSRLSVPNDNFDNLLKEIKKITGIEENRIKIKFGYPPKFLKFSIQNDKGKSLKELGIRSGESLIIERGEPIQTTKPLLTNQTTTNVQPTQVKTTFSGVDTNVWVNSKEIPSPPLKGKISLTNTGSIVRRVIASDNSCLFNSLAYVLEGCSSRKKKRADGLRKLISSLIVKNKNIYNKVVLGKENQAYAKEVLKKTYWGGAIELKLFSDFYKILIVAYDIQTCQSYDYGQDKNYDKMILVLFDGIHYDALALCPVSDGPEDFDMTIFSSKDSLVRQKALQFVKVLHKKNKFTDLSGFSVKCLQCGKGFKGQKEVGQHHLQTGHINFSEIKK